MNKEWPVLPCSLWQYHVHHSGTPQLLLSSFKEAHCLSELNTQSIRQPKTRLSVGRQNSDMYSTQMKQMFW